MFCPKCGGQKCEPVGSVFYEKGEFNGKQYDEEGNADEYVCQSCGAEFFVKD